MCYQKAAARLDIRTSVPGLNTPYYDFMFAWQYQSTDESDCEGPVDPNTEDEEECTETTGSKARPWISRPPTYRSTEVCIHTTCHVEIHLTCKCSSDDSLHCWMSNCPGYVRRKKAWDIHHMNANVVKRKITTYQS